MVFRYGNFENDFYQSELRDEDMGMILLQIKENTFCVEFSGGGSYWHRDDLEKKSNLQGSKGDV